VSRAQCSEQATRTAFSNRSTRRNLLLLSLLPQHTRSVLSFISLFLCSAAIAASAAVEKGRKENFSVLFAQINIKYKNCWLIKKEFWRREELVLIEKRGKQRVAIDVFRSVGISTALYTNEFDGCCCKRRLFAL